MNTDTADTIRHDVTNILRRAKPPKSNISREESQALRNLKKDNTVIILPADKGNATVVMNVSDYDKKITDLLQDSAYQAITSDPTTYLEKTTRTKIKATPIHAEVQKQIIPREKSSKCPKIYGLPKIHKEGVPLRPIVSSIGSPLQNLARYLARQLQPHTENVASYVKNSTHFIDIIKEVQVAETDILVSFDVVSLFTQIPIKEALNAIKNKYDPPVYLMNLVEHCLSNTYFIYNGQRYKQTEGAPMGSPLSPVIANLFMEDFEVKALQTTPDKPRLWLRYVDDTFVIWPHGREKLDKFLQHLNGIHQKIQFTMEIEDLQQLPFLDVLVYRKPNNSLGHTIYQKKTHTNRYLNGNSHHHPTQLNSVPKTLITRVQKLTDNDHKQTELRNLRQTLIQNQFKPTTIDRIIQQTNQNINTQNATEKEDNNWQRVFLPYVHGTTDKIARTLRKYQLKTIFTTDQKISNVLQTPKYKINLEEQGVYEIPCSMCPASYIGQTNRRINVRRDEHINAVRKQEKTSSLYQHQTATGHDINFEGTKIVAKVEHFSQRIVREAIEIEKRPNNMNKRDDTTRLPYIWKTALIPRRIDSPFPTDPPQQQTSENAPPTHNQATNGRAPRTTRQAATVQIPSEKRVTRSQTKFAREETSPEDGK